MVQSWDTAFSAEPGSAFSVCTTWGYLAGRWYLLDVARERLEYYDLKRRVVELFRRWKPDRVIIEKASSGEALWQDFRAEGPFRPVLWSVAKSKEERLRAQTGQMEAGKIVLPSEAPWLDAYLHELKGAPSCRYWDQVDSTTQFLDYAMSRQGWINQDVDAVTGRKLTIRRRQSINRR